MYVVAINDINSNKNLRNIALKTVLCIENFWLIYLELHISEVFFIQNGNVIPVSVKEGDEVLLPEYGGTKISFEDKVCCVFTLKAFFSNLV